MDSSDAGTVVAETAHSEIVLDSFGFYAQCKHGGWVSEYTPAKYKARMFAIMHDDDRERTCHPNDVDQRGPQR